MPRGFLVKRTRRCPASYRSRSRTRSSNAPDARSGDRSGSGAAVQSAFPSGPLPVWSAHVESALEAEADRRAQLPETEEQVREVLTPDSGFSCFFPPPPPLSPRNLTSRSPVKPVGTRLLDLHLHHHLHEEQELLEQPLFPGRCLTSSPVPGLPELPFLVSSTPPPVSASMERLLASSSRRAPPRAPGDPYDPSAAHLHLFPQLALVNQKRAFLEQEQRVNGHRHTGKPVAQKKPKVTRKLNFEDEVTTSPVLGLRIKKELPETRRPASGTGNRPLGEYICQLCREEYPDPVSLAQHKCSRIVRVEYRCPECDKVFSCPANLASHRRWHKPRPVTGPGGEPPGNKSQPLQEARGLVAHERPPVETEGKENELLRVNTNRHRGASRREPSLLLHDSLAPPHYDASLHYRNPVESCLDLQADSPPDPPQLPPQLPPLPTVQYAQPVPEEEAYECRYCGKKFRRQAYLKKHLAAHELASPNPSYGQAREATGGQSHVFLCHLCGARFPSVDIRDKHRLWHAMRDELLAGGLGGAAGLRPDGYRAQGADGGEREQQQQLYACKLCPSTFFSSPGLARHVDKSHCTENRQVMLLQMTVRP